MLPAEDVLIVTGLHVPLIPLFDAAGSDGGVDPWHSGPICVNVGVVEAFTTIIIVAVVPH